MTRLMPIFAALNHKKVTIMKTRKIILSGIFGLAIVAGVTSCGNGKTEALQSQIDSLYTTDSLHQEDIRQMADFVNVMSVGLDSISAQEGLLQQMGNREGGAIDKNKMRSQLQQLAETLQRQRERIVQLEASVKDNKSAYGQRISKLIAAYKAQLDEKDQKIASLEQELNEKNTNIAKLNESVSNLTTSNTQLKGTVETQTKTLEAQKTTIAEQDASLHTGFVAIGSSKDLKAKGIITGGFLAKKKVNVAELNTSKFTRVDIRKYNDIRLNSNDPKIMTQMPGGSYELNNNGDGTTTLHIKDTQLFWSVSKYLVVKL